MVPNKYAYIVDFVLTLNRVLIAQILLKKHQKNQKLAAHYQFLNNPTIMVIRYKKPDNTLNTLSNLYITELRMNDETSEKNKVLLLFAHPSLRRSEINKPMFETASKIDGVTAIDLYAQYPTFQIDIDAEQQLLEKHDIIVFQFPLYWYSTPSMLKEWQDLVLEHGFAYGEGGTALMDKSFMCALTAGGSEDAYRKDGYNHFTISELLHPLEQMANLTHMTYLPPFTLFGSRTAVEEGKLGTHLDQWRAKLDDLVRGPKAGLSIKQDTSEVNE